MSYYKVSIQSARSLQNVKPFKTISYDRGRHLALIVAERPLCMGDWLLWSGFVTVFDLLMTCRDAPALAILLVKVRYLFLCGLFGFIFVFELKKGCATNKNLCFCFLSPKTFHQRIFYRHRMNHRKLSLKLQLVRFARCCTSVWISILKISKLLQNCWHRVIDITSFEKTFGKFFRSYSELLSKFADISFQGYVSKGISHPVFYGDLVCKLRRVKDTEFHLVGFENS